MKTCSVNALHLNISLFRTNALTYFALPPLNEVAFLNLAENVLNDSNPMGLPSPPPQTPLSEYLLQQTNSMEPQS